MCRFECFNHVNAGKLPCIMMGENQGLARINVLSFIFAQLQRSMCSPEDRIKSSSIGYKDDTLESFFKPGTEFSRGSVQNISIPFLETRADHFKIGLQKKQALENRHARCFAYLVQLFLSLRIELFRYLTKGEISQCTQGNKGAEDKQKKDTSRYFAAQETIFYYCKCRHFQRYCPL